MTENPYATPAADLDVALPRELFPELSTKAIRKLKNHSTNIKVMGYLWVATFAVGVAMGISATPHDLRGALVTFALAVAFGVLAVGCFTRPAWMRIPGLLGCVLGLLSFPLGTLIGLIAGWSFLKGKPLFGPERLKPADLARELRYRKQNKVE